ncbi:uncharacterized protein AB675_5949 [Cyphellophora attinorum]|uniref:Uncharacterized protein n=1 Tax=Cyphellophora attinorum TaxID=1664694 RepID=A0A0N1H277_9EURO|nr:uncharacterized protein AB675_5949 [Phialophora attinorum]KPI38693.1 hypothetical protein AB675_5949 [Phialophora attinorum]
MSTESKEDVVVLYDIPSREPCSAWSLNPWKTRLVLNYKNIPYRTEWVEYPDLAPTLSKLVPKRESATHSTEEFTSPTITLPDGTAIMDSLAIAKALEQLQPKPSLQLDSPLLDKVTTLIFQIRTALVPIFMPLVHKLLLPERSAEYFRRTREQRTGRTLEEIYNDPETGGAKAWEKGEKDGLRELGELYKRAKKENGGPFLEGKEPGFADFVVAGQMRMFERLGHLEDYIKGSGKEVGEMYERVGRGWKGMIIELIELCLCAEL